MFIIRCFVRYITRTKRYSCVAGGCGSISIRMPVLISKAANSVRAMSSCSPPAVTGSKFSRRLRWLKSSRGHMPRCGQEALQRYHGDGGADREIFRKHDKETAVIPVSAPLLDER